MIPSFPRHRIRLEVAIVVVVVCLGGTVSNHGPRARAAALSSAQGAFDPAAYLPSVDDIAAALMSSPLNLCFTDRQGISDCVPVAAPAPESDWAAAARYVFPATMDSAQFVFDIAVSVYPTAIDAADALDKVANDLLSANSPSREYPQNTDWADHARAVRYDFTDPDTGAARGSYTQLIREGCALVMVSAQGGPVPEFMVPAVDNDRALLLGVISQELDGNLLATPAPCSGD